MKLRQPIALCLAIFCASTLTEPGTFAQGSGAEIITVGGKKVWKISDERVNYLEAWRVAEAAGLNGPGYKGMAGRNRCPGFGGLGMRRNGRGQAGFLPVTGQIF